MNNTSNNTAVITIHLKLILFITSLVLAGCIAGKATHITPAAGRASYTCGNVTVQPDSFYSDGFGILYYFVPLFPLPNQSETDSSLELPITLISSVEPVFNLSLKDMSVRIPGASKAIQPNKIDVMTENVILEKPWYYKTFKFTFDVDRHLINEFVLVFSKPFHGCDIPDTPYLKKEQTKYMTPVNGP